MGPGFAEFLDIYIFHWTPAKAIWIGGHTLSWDARCAGIYAGFGGGVLYQAAARWHTRELPSVREFAVYALFLLPLFLDVLSITLNLRATTNDVRYLTGVLFGSAFGACLFPALAVLGGPPAQESRPSHAWREVLALFAVGAIVLAFKEWNSVIAYWALQALCMAGFAALMGILAVGTWRAANHLAARHGGAKFLLLIVAVAMLAGCATTAPSPAGSTCNAATFFPPERRHDACLKEVCQDGKVVLVEDLEAMGRVDDWAEERFCLWHPFRCYQANQLKKKTEQWQKSLMGQYWTKKDIRNGLYDAARHAHLMCAIAERYGADFATGLGIAHEEDSEYLIFFKKAAPGNPCCEKIMDLHNNDVGVSLADKPGTCEDKVLSSLHLLRHSLCPRQTREEY